MSNSIDLDFHSGQPRLTFGPRPAESAAIVILIHGRGDSAGGILTLAEVLDVPRVAFVAPQARGNTWYPNSFLAPLRANEPGIPSGIHQLAGIVEELRQEDVDPSRIIVAGFSQGACLASEFVARNPGKCGGLVVLSGGLIGKRDGGDRPPPYDKTFDYDGDLAGIPVFMGCSDIDPHIPLERFEQTAEVLRELGGEVTAEVYTGMGHTVNDREIGQVKRLITTVSEREVAVAEQRLMKDGLGPDAVERVAQGLSAAEPGFPIDQFRRMALAGLEKLELKERVHHLIAVMAECLPDDFERCARVLANIPDVFDRGDPDDNLRDLQPGRS